ncbi:MAG: tetratricopeptide repeat protein, partial [Candidatus Hydrogenedentes bacterium]|nr:tetratricopeptide repeat protein [Candidatus Hydrogenedentota bacterium]
MQPKQIQARRRAWLSFCVLALVLAIEAGCASSRGKKPEDVPPEKRFEQARKAVAHHPNDPTPLYQMGNALFDLQRYEDAAAAYEGVLSLDPNHASAHVNLGL